MSSFTKVSVSEQPHSKRGDDSMIKTLSAIRTTIVLSIFLLTMTVLSLPSVSVAAQSTTILHSYDAFIQDRLSNGLEIYKQDAMSFQVTEIAVSQQNIKNDALILENLQQIEFEIEAPTSGLYYMALTYQDVTESILPVSVEMTVNGEMQYQEMQNLEFKSLWQREKEVQRDRYNNEISPDIHKVNQAVTSYLTARNGYHNEPLLISLQAGTNKIELTSTEGTLNLLTIHLIGQDEVPVLNVESDPTEEVEGDMSVTIQAEQVYMQNSSSIRPGTAFNDSLTPYSNENRVLNFLDGASFRYANDQIIYQVEVPTAGYYFVSLHYQQDARVDFPVFVNVSLNGQIPSESLINQALPYSASYQDVTFINQSTQSDLPIYFEEGINELSFQITLNPVKNVLERTESLIKDIQALSLQIENLLGGSVDTNRDIDLEDYIPGIPEQLLVWADELALLQDEVIALTKIDATPGAFQQLKLAETQLRDLGETPRKIGNRWNELAKGGASVTAHLATLLQEATDNGVSIDEIVIHQTEKPAISQVGFIEGISNSFQRFFQSFSSQDYDVANDSDNLQVWVNRPRQYIEIMQQMIDQSFTVETGIQVDLSIMPDQNKLILANSSGNEPDVALGVGYALPFDLAIRGALADLTQFDGFEDVATNYSKNLLIPAAIGESVYAMPETMNFYVLFYRKDILDSLSLPIPDTMQELVNLLPALKQRGMSAFYPTATLGTSFKIFPWTMPMIYQSGGDFYTDSILETGLATDATIEGMRDLTDLFTIYSLPVDVPSFYQQFRDGSIPIGISDFGTYLMILNAAPEIANLWDIALVPGVENEEGEVQRWTSGGAESSIMFSDSERKDEAWEFMQWWLSAEVQTEFGVLLQTTYGREYMWNTANLEAFAELPWSTSHKNVILEQSQWIAEVPRTLGGYMVEREVSRLYTSVVVDGENLRKSNDLSIKRINREVLRKLEEFGYIVNGEWVMPYEMPNIENLLVEEGMSNDD